MRKNILLSFLFLSTASFAFAQIDSLWNLDRLSYATVLLAQPAGESGTATIISHNSKVYLLTANHVSSVMKADAIVIFRIAGDKPYQIGLRELLSKNEQFIPHEEADISIIPLNPLDKTIGKALFDRAFPSNQISILKLLPSKEEQICFLGYPIIDMKLEHFYPISFKTTLASGYLTQLRGDTKRPSQFFYLNSPSMQGCSGGPVFSSVLNDLIYVGTSTHLIGVVHGTASDNTGGKLSSNTPAFYIWDLLNSLKN